MQTAGSSFPADCAPRDPSAFLRPVRGASAGFCRPDVPPARALRPKNDYARPFSPPTAGDRQTPKPDRRWRWLRERTVRALVCSWRVPSDLHGDFGGVKRGSEPLLFAVISRAIPKAWPSDAGRVRAADDGAI